MNEKIRVVTVVGTRPEIIRLSRVMAKLDESEAIDHIAVHTGQNYDYELNQIFYSDLAIRKPDYFLDAAGSKTVETIANILIKIDSLLEQLKPDAFLILGDTNSCLSAMAAKKRHIPVFHMEAGNRCFDERVPEETNRKIVDHISDINLTYSDIAREYLLSEGLSADRVIKTGSPMYEVLNYYLPQINKSDILKKLNLEKGKFFVVSAHREENLDSDKNFAGLIESLNLIAEKFKLPIIVTTHPRTRKLIETRGVDVSKEVQFLKPLGFTDYNALQISSFAVLSDSGTISEESSILDFNALNIRDAHERPEAMEEASVILTGLKPERILQGLSQLQHELIAGHKKFRLASDYSMPNVSDKVVRIILSYIDYVNRKVWFKY
jgi:UDP-N-acetylglucosamine 2-epimerase (non-hydrolysing)